MEITNGPLHAYGSLSTILSAAGQGQAASVVLPDPNDDRGPNMFFMGSSMLDIRCFYPKDKVAGYTGAAVGHYGFPLYRSNFQIPAAAATNNIVTALATTLNTAMVLATIATGITPAVPITPFAGFGQFGAAAVVTTGLALDFGFAFGNVTAASTTVTVADSTQFKAGMPLVIGGVGNAAGTTCLLTNVASITDSTHIVVVDTPLATLATAPIGTGNLWGPSENGFPTPTAAQPFLTAGPALLLDPAQSLARGVQVSSADGGALGGTFTVAGYDVYGMAMTEALVHLGGATTIFGNKAFKYIVSVTPSFTDPALYNVGTSDVFGFAMRANEWESTSSIYDGNTIGGNAGFTAAVATTATSATGDVRGTLQLSINGPGGGIFGGNTTNGTIVSLAMSGRRLCMGNTLTLLQVLNGHTSDTRSMYGVTQA